MGAVFAARQPAMRREVALKVMLRNVSAHDRLRFIEEAQITGQLEHPNIVPVHDLALNDHGQPYYTMKLVKGSTLKEILKLLAKDDTVAIAKYPLSALLTIFQKVCDAVAFAHARGVIHRDLKPANIMVGEFGEVLVMDWGLAKIIGRDGAASRPGAPGALGESALPIATARDDQHQSFATLDGAVMGTPQYMSPEQARGEVATLDQRSDLFSLGAILYELFTLLPPFPGKTSREILSKIKSGHFDLPNARLRATNAQRPQHLPGGAVPESLEAVILKALARDPVQRYWGVEDLQNDLTAYQGGFATKAENAGALKQFTLLIKRHKTLSIAVAASILLLAGVSAAFTLRLLRENVVNLRHLHEASMADYAVAVQRLGEDNRWGEGVAHLARALDLEPKNPLPAMRLYGDVASDLPNRADQPRFALRHEHLVSSASFSSDGTRIVTASYDSTARVWDAATGKPLGEPMRHGKEVLSANFSPDGTRIVTASTDSTARVWDAATGKPLGELMRHEGSVRSASFSPDGTRIVTASKDETARVWDAATGKLLGEPMSHGREVLSANFSPDGTRIVTTSADSTARVWDAATGKPLGEPMRHESLVNRASFSPDGMRIVTASGDKTARVWDAATGKPLGEAIRHEGSVRSASFSPDGTRIVTASFDSTARVWDAATGKPLGEEMRHEGGVLSANFSPDGRRIVTASTDSTARVWDVATGKSLGEAMRHESFVRSASFSPDGLRIVTACADSTARVWDAATGKPLGEAMRHEGGVSSASFSPDGTRIVTASADSTARVWDAATGKPLGEPMRHEGGVSSANFSPDGTRIVTASADKTARVWEVKSCFHLLSPTPEWVREWARAVAGFRFDSEGAMQPMPMQERLTVLYYPHDGNDPWSRLARWVATDPAKRTIDPDSPHTCREIAERERDYGSKESLESAIRYDPAVPLARLMLAKFEEIPQHAAFLRDYDLKRLPSDAALWERAVRSLHEQKDDARARQALQKLEKLAPEKARMLKAELGL